MKKNNRKATISEKDKAFYLKLMFDIMAIEWCYDKRETIVKLSPQVERRFWLMIEN